VARQHAAVTGQRRVQLPLLAQQGAEIHLRLNVTGSKPQRLAELAGGGRDLAQIAPYVAKVVMRFRPVRLTAYRGLKPRGGLRQAPGAQQGEAVIEGDIGPRRRGLAGPLQQGQRPRIAAPIQQHAKPMQRLDIARIGKQAGAIRRLRLVQTPCPMQR
jgi:hypothetical protein